MLVIKKKKNERATQEYRTFSADYSKKKLGKYYGLCLDP